MRKIICFMSIAILIFALILGTTYPVSAATESNELDQAISRTSMYLLQRVRVPQVGTVGGEWTIIGLARSNQPVPPLYFRRYFRAVEQHVRQQNGVLDTRRITEYSRVILGLTAAGFDPQNVGGVDLTLPLGDFERTTWQGINGAIFALLALDSLDYEIPINRAATTQATRELYVAEILSQQAPNGGWSLTGVSDTIDPDITGMALQALAKYQEGPQVSDAIESALNFISSIQNEYGGFTRTRGEPTVESTAQVLVALTELGIPLDDPRFVQNGNTVLDNLLSFQNPNGSFRHTLCNPASNLLSTETGLYALVAAQRARDGQNSLYRMGAEQ
ncbi:MAG: terpene cyclase/mutase family protein [Defluviitaleaceae bacterium]|nr:terpene cyclase/mutase family protein [Defluviitaleaceae bacterium]